MNVLLITPGYISHYGPLSIFAKELHLRGYSIYVATHKAIQKNVERDGFHFIDMSVWESSNIGKVVMENQPINEQERLNNSYESTKRGMVSALKYQAEHRLHDLLWQPDRVALAIKNILNEIKPKLTICVQLCYNANAALIAYGVPFVTYVTGHPLQLPTVDEIYGIPYVFPKRVLSQPEELKELTNLCQEIQEKVTTEFNNLLLRLNPSTTCVKNAFATASKDLILFNYPKDLARERAGLYPSRVKFIGSSVRDMEKDPILENWIRTSDHKIPLIYISFGTVFSVRSDVLLRVFKAVGEKKYRVILSSGVLDDDALKKVNATWYVQKFLPQLQAIRSSNLVIGHGGNNTITESLTFGVPLLVAPFASDQFFGAAYLENNGVGAAFDPNFDTIKTIEQCIDEALLCKEKAELIGNKLRERADFFDAVETCCSIFSL